MAMTAADVCAVVDALERSKLFVSVDGGWGVDALLGRQTRPHDDLDLVIDIEQVRTVCECLGACGYSMQADEMPTRFVLVTDGDRRIDFHPMYFDATGFAHQRLPGGKLFSCRTVALGHRGRIGGREVQCLSPELQLAAHTGYEPDAQDRQDVELLCCRFELPLPPAYREGRR